mgnify:CR=1 FL=1
MQRAVLVVAQALTPFARSVVADMQGKQVCAHAVRVHALAHGFAE